MSSNLHFVKHSKTLIAPPRTFDVVLLWLNKCKMVSQRLADQARACVNEEVATGRGAVDPFCGHSHTRPSHCDDCVRARSYIMCSVARILCPGRVQGIAPGRTAVVWNDTHCPYMDRRLD